MNQSFYINGRFLTQRPTGVQSFAKSVCRELQDNCDFELLVPARSRRINDDFSNKLIPTGIFKGHLWEQFSLPVELKKSGKPLLNLCNTAPVHVKNQVVVLHDIAFKKHPEWFHPAFSSFYNWLIPKIVVNSKAVITVSNFIKSEIADAFGINESKILVTGNKVADSLLSATPSAPSDHRIVSGSYFLMTGSLDPRKNFHWVADIFSRRFPEDLLVIAGPAHRNFRSRKMPGAANVIYTGYVHESNLSWLYTNAKGFINPSLYEGFGIPNLEALAFECPVVCSDLPVFREICGVAASYFPSGDEEAFVELVKNVSDNNSDILQKQNAGKSIFTQFQSLNRVPVFTNALTI